MDDKITMDEKGKLSTTLSVLQKVILTMYNNQRLVALNFITFCYKI